MFFVQNCVMRVSIYIGEREFVSLSLVRERNEQNHVGTHLSEQSLSLSFFVFVCVLCVFDNSYGLHVLLELLTLYF